MSFHKWRHGGGDFHQRTEPAECEPLDWRGTGLALEKRHHAYRYDVYPTMNDSRFNVAQQATVNDQNRCFPNGQS
jgi:hypothetical protein